MTAPPSKISSAGISLIAYLLPSQKYEPQENAIVSNPILSIEILIFLE